MKISLDTIIHFLHRCPSATLASHAHSLPGYPYASSLSFVTDAQHCPVFLISQLAEHTHNLQADGRASLLLQTGVSEAPETEGRLTMLGDVTPMKASPTWLARYLRYQPSAERYLALGDFAFYRLQPRRLRFVAGFGQMGWVEADAWQQAPSLSLEDEQALLAQIAPGQSVLGIDCYGVDLLQAGRRERIAFAQAFAPAALPAQLQALGLLA